MPPASQTPSTDVSHMLPEHVTKKRRSGAGPMIGIVIIILLTIFGALYFWGAAMNRADEQPLPLIPGDSLNS